RSRPRASARPRSSRGASGRARPPGRRPRPQTPALARTPARRAASPQQTRCERLRARAQHFARFVAAGRARRARALRRRRRRGLPRPGLPGLLLRFALRCHGTFLCDVHGWGVTIAARPRSRPLATFVRVTALDPAAPIVSDRALTSRVPYAITIFLGAFLLFQ